MNDSRTKSPLVSMFSIILSEQEELG
jgi:hypothetical protein